MTISEKITVFIIDDHQIVINGINKALNDQFDIEVIGSACSAEESIEKVGHLLPDVLLLDIQLPEMDGIELCKVLHKKHPNLKIVGLTTFSQVSFIAEMLRNGAVGYLFKNTTEAELSEAIRTVHNGRTYLSEEVNQRLLAKAMNNKMKNFIPKLTRREKEILELIVEEHTSQEIADKLYLALSTVETHRMNLCSKLDARNTAGLVKRAIKFGLI